MQKKEIKKVLGKNPVIVSFVGLSLPIAAVFFFTYMAYALNSRDPFGILFFAELFMLPLIIGGVKCLSTASEYHYLYKKLEQDEITPSFYFTPHLVTRFFVIIDDRRRLLHLGKNSFPVSDLKRIEKAGPEVRKGKIRFYMRDGEKAVFEAGLISDLRNQYTRLLNHLYNAGYWRR